MTPGSDAKGDLQRPGIDQPPDIPAFVAAFGEWAEACWFAEHDRAPGRLEALLAFPPDVVLVGSLELLRRLLELSDSRGLASGGPGRTGDVIEGDIGAALAQHLLVTGPDPPRERLIRAVVVGAGASRDVRRKLLLEYGPEAVTGAALECSSVLTQTLANRWGVVPTNILEDL